MALLNNIFARRLLGRTDGSTPGVGDIGETLTAATIATSTTTGVSEAVNSTNALNLTAGSWIIYYSGSFSRNASVATSGTMYCGMSIYNTSDNVLINEIKRMASEAKDGGGIVYPGAQNQGAGTVVGYVTLSTTKTFRGKIVSEIVSGATGSWISVASSGELRAVRIA